MLEETLKHTHDFCIAKYQCIKGYHRGNPFVRLFLSQRLTHRRAGVCFRYRIKVAVDIGGSEYQQSSHVGVLRYFLSGGGVLSISL